MRPRARRLVAALCVLVLAALAGAPPAAAQGTIQVVGSWTGARLRCQKDEGKMVRCGTPAPFAVVFAEGGTGTTADDSLPASFTWRWLSASDGRAGMFGLVGAGLLPIDVLLPVPSSIVGTMLGARLGFTAGFRSCRVIRCCLPRVPSLLRPWIPP